MFLDLSSATMSPNVDEHHFACNNCTKKHGKLELPPPHLFYVHEVELVGEVGFNSPRTFLHLHEKNKKSDVKGRKKRHSPRTSWYHVRAEFWCES